MVYVAVIVPNVSPTYEDIKLHIMNWRGKARKERIISTISDWNFRSMMPVDVGVL